ncbi:MAG: D-TA family PLP-dependent enzyme [Bacteroidales bacterium]
MVKSVLSEDHWYLLDNPDQVSSPGLLIYPERIKENIRRMLKIAGDAGMLRPHVKTHKMPEIIRMQMNAGIFKFKCATISEAEMVAACGAKDILLALQPVGPNLARFFHLREEYRESNISCIADSGEVISRLSERAVRTGLETGVWLDVNNGTDRTGVEPGENAMYLAKKISGMPMLKFKGLHVYDGHIREKDIARREEICNNSFAPLVSMIGRLKNEGIGHPGIVAGGTSTFPVHSRRHGVECSPGTPVLWDVGYSTSFPDIDFLYAAVLFTRIISRPAKNLICLDLGYKAVASEMPQPRVILFGIKDYDIISHSEEHLVIRTNEADSLRTGDHFYGLPWHICPTVDRFDSVSVVNERSVTGQWNVTARNRKITI